MGKTRKGEEGGRGLKERERLGGRGDRGGVQGKKGGEKIGCGTWGKRSIGTNRERRVKWLR